MFAIHFGKGHHGYGFDKKTTKNSELKDCEYRWTFIREEAFPQTIEILEQLSEEYEQKYRFPRTTPQEQ